MKEKTIDAILRPFNIIHCKEFDNFSCVKCGTILAVMVKVGVMIFCAKCHLEEFNGVPAFSIDSNLYKETYLYWINQYMKLG